MWNYCAIDLCSPGPNPGPSFCPSPGPSLGPSPDPRPGPSPSLDPSPFLISFEALLIASNLIFVSNSWSEFNILNASACWKKSQEAEEN